VPKRLHWTALALIIPLAAIGCLQLAPLDDFRLLQTPDPDVQAEDQFVRRLLEQDYASQFFLVRGDDAQSILEREEDLIASLRPLLDRGDLGSYTALSRFVPSPARQRENHRLISQLAAGENAVLASLVAAIGLPEETRERYVRVLRESVAQPPLTLSAWLAQPASAPFRDLWVETENGVFSVVALSGVQSVGALRQIAETHSGVTLIDRVGDLSGTFTAYRSKTLWLTAASYLAVSLVLCVRYGLLGALSVIAVPLAAAAIAFGTLGFLSEPVSLFNVMALLLILGIGVDYAIFFREAGAAHPTTILAVTLSALTTILAFGLLAASSTLAVHAFGITLLIGIAAAVLLAPLAATLPFRSARAK
jgi:predicted exporter